MSKRDRKSDARPPDWHARLIGRANALLLIGGLLNIVVVAFGVRDVLAWPLVAAFGFASFLIALQYILGRSLSGSGFLHGIGCSLLYLFVIGVNLILAVSGIVAIAAPDALGRRSFEAVVAVPRAQIIAVADNLDATEMAVSALSRQSDQRAAVEATSGSSCGPSPKGEGPIFRLRMRDRDRFAELAAAFAGRAATTRQVRAELDAAIAGYSVEQHAALASRIDTLVERARQSAADPAIHAMRAELRTRLSGVRSTTPDPSTGAVVRCPDQELDRALSGVLAVAPPGVPAVEAIPQEPSHRAAAMAFARQIGNWWHGAPFDSEMWGMPVTLGFFPDAVFLLGLMKLKRDRRELLGISGRLARRVTGKEGAWSDAAAAAEEAAEDPRLAWLLRYHSRRSRWYGHTDCLTVPADHGHEAFLQCMGLVQIGDATYHGLGPAKLLLEGAHPRPADGEVESHFFVLRHKTWERLLIESMRDAASSRPRLSDEEQEAEAPEWREAAE